MSGLTAPCARCGATVELALNALMADEDGKVVGRYTAWIDSDTTAPHACLAYLQVGAR